MSYDWGVILARWKTPPFLQIATVTAAALALGCLGKALDSQGGYGASSYTSPSSGSSGSAPPPPSALTCPAGGDQRIAQFRTIAVTARSEPKAGKACEDLTRAFAMLHQGDQGCDATIGGDYAAATTCKGKIADSDNRLRRLLDAYTRQQASPDTAAQTVAMLQAWQALDDPFDKTRESLSPDMQAAMAAAPGAAKLLAESDDRLKVFIEAARPLAANRTPEVTFRLVDAYQRLTSFDRSRLRDTDRPLMNEAEKALGEVRLARQHFGLLQEYRRKAESGSATGEELLGALGQIKPSERTLATPEQRQMLEEAQRIAIPLALTALEKRLAILARTPDSPEATQSVASLYDVLKSIPTENLTTAQRDLIARARRASERIEESDNRLKALREAAAEWRARGKSATTVLDALRAITDFDRSRFKQPEQDAMVVLGSAEAILLGPAVGFSSRAPMFVTDGEGRGDLEVVRVLGQRLRNAGFAVVTDAREAAVIVRIVVDSVSTPKLDTSQLMSAMVSVARLQLSAVWSVNDTPLFPLQQIVQGEARVQGNDNRDPRQLALSDAVNKAVDRFKSLATR